ncbi:uncharacterized protein LOC144448107 [Glandiceps talaboti]
MADREDAVDDLPFILQSGDLLTGPPHGRKRKIEEGSPFDTDSESESSGDDDHKDGNVGSENKKQKFDDEDNDKDESEEDDDDEDGDDDDDDDDEEEDDDESDHEANDGEHQAEEEEGESDDDNEEEEGEDDSEDDSEDDDDDDEEDDDNEDEENEEDETHECSDVETEKCPVCLNPFEEQDVGTPESCDHTFCLECILEWSKNVNTCPVDRQLFRSILVRHSYHGTVVRRIEVDDRTVEEDEDDGDEPTYCEVCGRCDREDRLLLCDGCDSGYHCECLDPPLESIPIEEWFCPECTTDDKEELAEIISSDEDELLNLLDDQTPDLSISRLRQRPMRAIARTRVSERVRANVQRARERARERAGTRRATITTERSRTTPRARSTSTTKRSTSKTKTKKTTRKRKTTKRKGVKRKTRKKKTPTSKTKTGTKRKTKKRRRRRKTKGRRTKTSTKKRTSKVKAPIPKTVRGRIANKLGLVKARTGSIVPDVKGHSARSLDYRRSEIGVASLSLTGDDGFLYQGEEAGASTQHATVSGVATTGMSRRHVKLLSRSALCSHQPVAKPMARRRENRATETVSIPTPPVLDLLGSIMQGQTLLHMPSSNVTISRDGSLKPNISSDTLKSPTKQPVEKANDVHKVNKSQENPSDSVNSPDKTASNESERREQSSSQQDNTAPESQHTTYHENEEMTAGSAEPGDDKEDVNVLSDVSDESEKDNEQERDEEEMEGNSVTDDEEKNQDECLDNDRHNSDSDEDEKQSDGDNYHGDGFQDSSEDELVRGSDGEPLELQIDEDKMSEKENEAVENDENVVSEDDAEENKIDSDEDQNQNENKDLSDVDKNDEKMSPEQAAEMEDVEMEDDDDDVEENESHGSDAEDNDDGNEIEEVEKEIFGNDDEEVENNIEEIGDEDDEQQSEEEEANAPDDSNDEKVDDVGEDEENKEGENDVEVDASDNESHGDDDDRNDVIDSISEASGQASDGHEGLNDDEGITNVSDGEESVQDEHSANDEDEEERLSGDEIVDDGRDEDYQADENVQSEIKDDDGDDDIDDGADGDDDDGNVDDHEDESEIKATEELEESREEGEEREEGDEHEGDLNEGDLNEGEEEDAIEEELDEREEGEMVEDVEDRTDKENSRVTSKRQDRSRGHSEERETEEGEIIERKAERRRHEKERSRRNRSRVIKLNRDSGRKIVSELSHGRNSPSYASWESSSPRVPISELPRIPKLKRERSEERGKDKHTSKVSSKTKSRKDRESRDTKKDKYEKSDRGKTVEKRNVKTDKKERRNRSSSRDRGKGKKHRDSSRDRGERVSWKNEHGEDVYRKVERTERDILISVRNTDRREKKDEKRRRADDSNKVTDRWRDDRRGDRQRGDRHSRDKTRDRDRMSLSKSNSPSLRSPLRSSSLERRRREERRRSDDKAVDVSRYWDGGKYREREWDRYKVRHGDMWRVDRTLAWGEGRREIILPKETERLRFDSVQDRLRRVESPAVRTDTRESRYKTKDITSREKREPVDLFKRKDSDKVKEDTKRKDSRKTEEKRKTISKEKMEKERVKGRESSEESKRNKDDKSEITKTQKPSTTTKEPKKKKNSKSSKEKIEKLEIVKEYVKAELEKEEYAIAKETIQQESLNLGVLDKEIKQTNKLSEEEIMARQGLKLKRSLSDSGDKSTTKKRRRTTSSELDEHTSEEADRLSIVDDWLSNHVTANDFDSENISNSATSLPDVNNSNIADLTSGVVSPESEKGKTILDESVPSVCNQDKKEYDPYEPTGTPSPPSGQDQNNESTFKMPDLPTHKEVVISPPANPPNFGNRTGPPLGLVPPPPPTQQHLQTLGMNVVRPGLSNLPTTVSVPLNVQHIVRPTGMPIPQPGMPPIMNFPANVNNPLISQVRLMNLLPALAAQQGQFGNQFPQQPPGGQFNQTQQSNVGNTSGGSTSSYGVNPSPDIPSSNSQNKTASMQNRVRENNHQRKDETKVAKPATPPDETMETVDMEIDMSPSSDTGKLEINPVIEEDVESSAVELYNKGSRDRYLQKLHHQERVVEEVKLAIKPFYQKKLIDKDEYKEILRKAVNKICHSRSGVINPVKIKGLVEGYVKKYQEKRKFEIKAKLGRPSVSSSSSSSNAKRSTAHIKTSKTDR